MIGHKRRHESSPVVRIQPSRGAERLFDCPCGHSRCARYKVSLSTLLRHASKRPRTCYADPSHEPERSAQMEDDLMQPLSNLDVPPDLGDMPVLTDHKESEAVDMRQLNDFERSFSLDVNSTAHVDCRRTLRGFYTTMWRERRWFSLHMR